MIIDRKDDIMNDSIYYKATDEDGNTVIKHAWKKHKYLYIKNGKYVYPEDVKKNVKKKAKFVKKVVTRDAAFKAAAARYLLDKASKSPTANAARAKVNSVKSKAEYKLTRAGEKLTNDVKSSGAYKSAKKGINSISKNANKAYKSAKKGINRISKNANKAYKSAKKEFNRISRDANKVYKSAKKKAKKVNRTFNKVKRAGKAYLDYLTK